MSKKIDIRTDDDQNTTTPVQSFVVQLRKKDVLLNEDINGVPPLFKVLLFSIVKVSVIKLTLQICIKGVTLKVI